MTPSTTLHGGEGLATLQVVQDTVTNRPTNVGIGGSSTLFLVPCGVNSATCTDLNTLTVACGNYGQGTTTTTDQVYLGNLQGSGTTTVSGTFTVPYAPNGGGYFVCIPYCSTSSCGGVAHSYTVLASSPAFLTFDAANPGTYSTTPTQPQARQAGTLTFTGTGLTASDEVKVINSNQQCTSTTASLLTNLRLGTLTLVSSTTATVSFIAPDLVTATITGKVCYRRSGSGLWASAYRNAASQVADFTISVMQPTSYTVNTQGASVGSSLSISFVGSGLDGSTDAAFLSSSSASDPCGDATTAEQFTCTMSGTSSPICTVVVDPSNENGAMELAVCYKRAAQTNYAQVSDTLLTLAARNPTFTASPSPIYAGQPSTLTFTGTSLSSTDQLQLIASGGVCGVAAPLTSVTVLSSTEVAAGTQYSFTIVGAADACATVCYYLSSQATWIVARLQTGSGSSSSTEQCNLYISACPIVYSFVGLASGVTPTVRETGRLSFTTTVPSVSAQSVVAAKLVQTANSCVTTPCSNRVACQMDAAATDYIGTVSGARVTFMAGTNSANYIVCVQLNANEAYIPIRLSGSLSTTSEYGFVVGAQNPTLGQSTPTVWRENLGLLQHTFLGTGLETTTDSVLPLSATNMLLADANTGVYVCPTASTSPSTLFAAAAATGSTTSVTFNFTRIPAVTVPSGTVVHLCYVWHTNGVARASYVGAVTVQAAVPSSLTWSNAPSDGYRAGDPVSATVTTTTLTLSTTTDTVFFYRYAASSTPNPNCYCDPTACAGGTLVTLPDDVLTASGSQSMTFRSDRGFTNYDFDAIYVVCYSAAVTGGGEGTYSRAVFP
ncbi:hypothetical protein AGDE_06696 [Angomonas deanei]|uniref:Uncharacterized protein n=1 Tax=Angomonas deanei TaxID=59799 RepID=A0A7G2CUN3_9TRYP|nr:hypothetical protein AGDE_06696 [Angomonas deanei]CAD2222947.1 hypothetical protein, conserved [Angomonas deanei]|eukprot:EPY36880.1 hypothetical protein AGDE_06696 [Angomonas deanei]